MRNNMRLIERLLALCLVFVLLFSMMPMAYATSDAAGEGQDATPVEIPETMYTIVAYAAAYDGNSHDAVTVTLQDGVTAQYSTDGVTYTDAIPTIQEVGELKVYVQLAADGYTSITKEVTATVTKAERPAMTFSVAEVGEQKVNNTLANPVNATDAAYEPQTVTYASSDESVATVDGSGTVTFLKKGSVTITATMPASDHYTETTASYTVSIGLQTMVLSFAQSEVELTFTDEAGAKTTNSLNDGAELPGKVTYTSSDDTIATVSESGEVSFLKAGTVTVTATMEETAVYASATASYTVTAKYGASVLSFAEAAPEAITYEDGLTFENIATGADDIVYSIESEKLDDEDHDVAEIDAAGMITVKSAGVITVKATVAETDDTYGTSATYTLTINRAARAISFAQAAQSIDWASGKVHTQMATGAENITYAISAESLDGVVADVADINAANGEITVKTAGVVTVKASAAQTDTYLAAEDVEYTLTINRVNQDALVFAVGTPADIAYKQTLDNAVSGGSGSGAVTYTVIAGEEYGTLNGSVLTAIKADGSVTVKATKAQDACYNEATATYTVNTIKATQPAFAFQQTAYTAIYGDESITVTAEGGVDGGKITYSVNADENGVIDTLNADTGEIIFADNVVSGTAEIKAVMVMENYENIEATATVTISEGALTPGAYAVSTEELQPSGWYTSNVVISAAEGYSLSLSGSRKAVFSDALTMSDEGDYTGENAQVFFVKDEQGHIVKQTAEFKIDKTAPEALVIKANDNTIQTIARVLTLGFYKNNVEITLSAKDDASGIVAFVYNTTGEFVEGGDVTVSADVDSDGNYIAKFPINAQYKDEIIFRAVNGAGLYSEATTDGVIVVDNVAPGILFRYTPDSEGDTEADQYKSVSDAYFEIAEDNFDSAKVAAFVTKDGVETALALTWTLVENSDPATYKATIDDSVFADEADYEVSIRYTEQYTDVGEEIYDGGVSKFTIDRTAPVIEVSYKNNEADSEKYFKAERVATITVTEHNFDAGDMVWAITVTDENGVLSNVPAPAVDSWKPVEGTDDTYEATIPYASDGDYAFQVDYADKANNVNDGITLEENTVAAYAFTIDQKPPVISYRYELEEGVASDEEYTSVYDGARTLIVQIQEHNFEESRTSMIITREDADGKISQIATPKWEEIETNVWQVEVPFEDAGDYKIIVDSTDKAGNAAKQVSDSFTIDKEPPVISYSYENAVDVKESDSYPTYFNGGRILTVLIEEHNFVPERVVWSITREGDDDKAPVDVTEEYAPSVSDWLLVEGETNVYMATVKFAEVGEYAFTVDCKDKAGNPAAQKSDSFTIDKEAPVISYSYENADGVEESKNYPTYFNGDRTLVVRIKEHNFVAGDVVWNITKEGDEDTKPADVTEMYAPAAADWKRVEGESNVYEATVEFADDGEYAFTVNYSDKAENAAEQKTDVFTVDKTAPETTITVTSDKEDTIVDVSYEAVDGTIYYNGDVTATIQIKEHNFVAGDVVWSIVKVDSEGNKSDVTADFAPGADDWSEKEANIHEATIQFTADGDYAVTVTYTDMANNAAADEVKHITIDKTASIVGVVFDNNTPDSEYTDIFNATRVATITIVEHNFDENRVTIVKGTGENGTGKADDGSEAVFSGWTAATDEAGNKIPNTWKATVTFSADGDYRFSVSCKDKAGNDSNTVIDAFTIDQTAPVISLSYSNNSPDSTYTDYYDANRTATITIKEHNFDEKRVTLSVTNTDGSVPTLSAWNHNGDVHTATLDYTADGDYEFSVFCKDMAGNGSNTVTDEFTIDKTMPAVSVSYDNNEALNGNYYNQTRTATITITEHNFVSDRVTVTLSATDDGEVVSVPAVNGWSNSGDVHTATIYYEDDALYTFDVAVVDMAGNNAADFEQQSFYVDRTAPELSITGVDDQSANNGDVIPVITYSDTNIDMDRVTITLTGANRKGVELIGAYEDIHNGQVFTFENFAVQKEIDDIYTLTATLIDLAGNESTQTITFSVNRFGSTYALSEEAEELNGTYVQEPIDVVIAETNTDELTNIRIVLYKNGESITLVENEDYEIKVTGGNGKWYKYTYTIFKENFQDDGVYSLTVYSEDAAGNVAENTLDTKGVEISFGVDKTAPTAFVANIEDGETYPVEVLTAILSANDNLKLSSVMVYLDDELYASWSEDEIAAILAGEGDFTFDILDDVNYAHDLRIVCVDAAGNETEVEISGFYVTTKWFVRYYTNEGLFYGSIAGLLLIVAVGIYLATRKKKETAKR